MFAPQSMMSAGRPGMGSRTATAGRWTPRMRLRWKSPAARAAPVGHEVTKPPARPSATARATWTIEASGFARTARAASSSFVIATGASTTFSYPSSSAAGPKIVTGTPERRPPSATLRGPRSAPFASSAITVRRLLGGFRCHRCHDLAAAVGAAYGADAVRQPRRVALRTCAQPRRLDRVLRAPLAGPRVGLLLLGDRHGRRLSLAAELRADVQIPALVHPAGTYQALVRVRAPLEHPHPDRRRQDMGLGA